MPRLPRKKGADMTELDRLLKESAESVKAMTPAERDEMYRKQRAGYVRAEMSWPAAKFKMVNGVKVYDSYEDYLND